MTTRLLLLAGMLSAFISAEPITMTFSGVADGELGGTSFLAQPFTITFSSDTTSVTHPCVSCTDENDWVTPLGTTAGFSIAQVGTLLNVMGIFEDDQAVFENPITNDIGIWHSTPEYDWLAKQDPAFHTYTLQSNIGPITTGVNNALPIFPVGTAEVDNSFNTTLGAFNLSNVTALSFEAVVTAPTTGGGTVSAVPEPSSLAMLSIGLIGLMVPAMRRRKRMRT